MTNVICKKHHPKSQLIVVFLLGYYLLPYLQAGILLLF